jgi:hypothetical protein
MPLNHQNVNTIENAQIPKQMALVSAVYRREEKIKWSSKWPSMRTEKYRVGSCVERETVSFGDE